MTYPAVLAWFLTVSSLDYSGSGGGAGARTRSGRWWPRHLLTVRRFNGIGRWHNIAACCLAGASNIARPTDPDNPLLQHVGTNYLKGRLRSHPAVAKRHYSDLIYLAVSIISVSR
jgi:hypothetical protein